MNCRITAEWRRRTARRRLFFRLGLGRIRIRYFFYCEGLDVSCQKKGDRTNKWGISLEL